MQTRRTFLVSAGATALASSTVWGANDTINVACIGTGGRCRTLMKSLAKVPGVRMTAVCDIWEKALAEGKALADPKAITSTKFQELLDRKDIDAVLIGSPDHWLSLIHI